LIEGIEAEPGPTLAAMRYGNQCRSPVQPVGIEARGVPVAATGGMLKKVRSKLRRRKIKKVVRRHASEALVGIALGLLTDILTDVVQAHLRKKVIKRFR
jgi:hypothetical protein